MYDDEPTRAQNSGDGFPADFDAVPDESTVPVENQAYSQAMPSLPLTGQNMSPTPHFDPPPAAPAPAPNAGGEATAPSGIKGWWDSQEQSTKGVVILCALASGFLLTMLILVLAFSGGDGKDDKPSTFAADSSSVAASPGVWSGATPSQSQTQQPQPNQGAQLPQQAPVQQPQIPVVPNAGAQQPPNLDAVLKNLPALMAELQKRAKEQGIDIPSTLPSTIPTVPTTPAPKPGQPKPTTVKPPAPKPTSPKPAPTSKKPVAPAPRPTSTIPPLPPQLSGSGPNTLAVLDRSVGGAARSIPLFDRGSITGTDFGMDPAKVSVYRDEATGTTVLAGAASGPNSGLYSAQLGDRIALTAADGELTSYKVAEQARQLPKDYREQIMSELLATGVTFALSTDSSGQEFVTLLQPE